MPAPYSPSFISAVQDPTAQIYRLVNIGNALLLTDAPQPILWEKKTYLPTGIGEITSRTVKAGDGVVSFNISGQMTDCATPELVHTFTRQKTKITIGAIAIPNEPLSSIVPVPGNLNPALGLPVYEPIFVGYVGGISIKDGIEWDIEVISLVHGADQPAGIVHSVSCNHKFGDRFCRVNVNAFKIAGTILSIQASRAVFTMSGNLPSPSTGIPLLAQYAVGTVHLPNRLGSGHNVSDVLQPVVGQLQIYLAAPMMADLIVGEPVHLFPDCDQSAGHCDQYNNRINFLAPALNSPTTAQRLSGI